MVYLKSCLILATFAVLGNCNDQDSAWIKNFQSGQSNVPLHRFGNKVYYLGIYSKSDWNGALHLCQSMSMQLLTINSDAENEKIQKYVRDAGPKYRSFWTGGTKIVNGGKWVWINNGNDIDYDNWGRNQPTAAPINTCLDVTYIRENLEWQNKNCKLQLHYICEKTVDPNPSNEAPGL